LLARNRATAGQCSDALNNETIADHQHPSCPSL
jgi:hypothetical protein